MSATGSPLDDGHDPRRAPAGADPAGGGAYRWVAMGVVLLGTFMVVLDTTVVNLGLPSMQREFGTVVGVEWVVTAYLAAVGVSQMSSGWFADRFGRKASFAFALVLFTVASVLCAAAPSLELLVGARVLQGVGGGMLLPVAMATIYELFAPSERGRALGIFGIAVMAAPAIGPVLGGSLVSSAGWRWLFLINVPIGAVGVPLALRLLRDTGFRERRRFDRLGLALTASGLTLLVVGLSETGKSGWTGPVLAMLAGAVLLLGLFVRHANRVEAPLVDLRILASPVFAVAMVTVGLMTIAQFSRLVYIPLELGSLRGISELRIGLTMLPSALGIAVTMPIGGRLADRIGARLPVSVAIVVLGASFWALANLTTSTPLPAVAAILFVGGLGAGLGIMAPNIVAMNSVRARDLSQASGLSNVSRQVSAAVGTALLAAIFAGVRPDGDVGAVPAGEALEAYRTVFLVSMGILAVALVTAQFLPGRTRALALQRERQDELASTSRAEPALATESS